MTFSAWAAKRRGLKISHCFSWKLQWILFERDKTDANVILMTLNIRNCMIISNVFGISTKWNVDKSIVRPAHVSWADNRFVCPPHKAISWTIELSMFHLIWKVMRIAFFKKLWWIVAFIGQFSLIWISHDINLRFDGKFWMNFQKCRLVLVINLLNF